MGNLNFNTLLDSSANPETADLRTVANIGTGAAANVDFLYHDGQDTYETILNVTTGKTYFLKQVIISCSDATRAHLATGAVASEAKFMDFPISTVNNVNDITFDTPIKISSGTRISGFISAAVAVTFTLIGWEE